MGKIILIVLFLFGIAIKSQICVVEIKNTDKYVLKSFEKRNDKGLTIFNDNYKNGDDDCYLSKQDTIYLYVEPVKLSRRVSKKEYTLSDAITCKIDEKCYFWNKGVFKINNKYYKYIEAQIDIDTASPLPKE